MQGGKGAIRRSARTERSRQIQFCRIIEETRKPDNGEIQIMGKKWKGNEAELHRVIGLSLQETHFIDKLNVRETLRLFAGFFGLGKGRNHHWA